MNYNININQKAIYDSNLELELYEAFILEAIRQMTSNWEVMEKIIANNKVYYWIDYDKVISDNPMLKGRKKEPMKRDTMYRYIKSLCEMGFLEAHPDNGRGFKTFFHLTSKVSLTYGQKSEPTDNNPNQEDKTYGQKSVGVRTEIRTDNNTKDNYVCVERAHEGQEENESPEEDQSLQAKEETAQEAPATSPTEQSAACYQPCSQPLPYDQVDAQEKIILFLQNPKNQHTLAVMSFNREALHFSAENWMQFVQYFIPTLYAEKNKHISSTLRQFPDLLNRAAQWLKTFKTAHQRPVPGAQKLCALTIDNKLNALRIKGTDAVRVVLGDINGNELYELFAPSLARILQYSDNLKDFSPLSEEEAIKLYIAGQSEKKFSLMLRAIEEAPKTKYNNKFNRFYDAIIAQYKYITTQK